jgi:hypothetical protein
VATLKLNLLATNIPTPTIIVTPIRTPITIPAFAQLESPTKDVEDIGETDCIETEVFNSETELFNTFFVWQTKWFLIVFPVHLVDLHLRSKFFIKTHFSPESSFIINWLITIV